MTAIGQYRQLACKRDLLPLNIRTANYYKIILEILSVLTIIFVLLAPAWATIGSLDPTFNPGTGVKQIPVINRILAYPDETNRSLACGYFTSMNGVSCNSLARFNSGGDLDTGFIPAINGEVRQAIILGDGRILVAGRFSVGSGGNTYYNVARLTSTGALDTSFYKTLGSQGSANAIGVQSDGKILVGGWSLTVAGDISATYHLLRLNNDGSLDISYTKLSTPNGLVTSIKILNDDAGNPNRAEVLGSMPNISGNHTGYLVTLFNTGAVQSYIGDETFNGLLSGYARDNLNRLVYTGLFTKALGVDRPNVARFNSNGTLDNSFNPGTGPNGEVTHLVIQSDNKVVLAGNFNRFSGHTVGYMARLNENGTFDSSFSGSADDRIFRLEAGGTNLLVVGSFRSVNNTTRNGAALLDVNGNLSGNYASLTNDNSKPAYVYAVMTQSDGKVLVGGDFTGMQGKFHRGIARLNYDGSLDQTFTASVDGYIRTIALQNDGRILLGGSFGACSGYPRASLVRIDPNIYPSVDDAFNPVITKLDGSVSELYRIVPVNDQIMVAGHFRKINLVNQSIAARFFSNGTVDAGFNAQITITNSSNMWATDLIPTKDGKYMICGYVTYESLGRGWLTRLTGTGAMDTTFTPTTPSPNVVITAGQVRDMLLQPDGKSVIVGDFSEIIDGSLFNRPQRGGIARFNVNGALDNTLTTDIGANHWVTSIVLQSSGKFIIGGYFTKYNVPNYGDPDNAHRLAQVNSNGSFSPTFKAIPGADNALSVITLTSGGRKAYIGGQFTTYDGVVRNGIARIITNRSGTTPVYYLLLN